MGIGNPKLYENSSEIITIGDALFTKVQQQVLGLLFSDSDRSYYANEIIRLAKTGTGAVQRELKRLEASGLVVATRQGNQMHYQANHESPVFDDLRSLILKTVGLATPLKAALISLKDKITFAFVYGSMAKNQFTAKSDVDLMVISDEITYSELYEALEPVHEELGRTVNPTLYSVHEFEKRRNGDNAFVLRVLSQPKIWLIGNDREIKAGKS